jgi:hypothetical protein
MCVVHCERTWLLERLAPEGAMGVGLDALSRRLAALAPARRRWLTFLMAIVATIGLSLLDPDFGIVPLAQPGAQAPTLRDGAAPVVGGMQIVAGSLHDHSTDSDGGASAGAIFRFEYVHRHELGLDFASLSDHADFLPFSYEEPLHGNVWERQLRLVHRYSQRDFSILRNFEITSDQENHFGVIGAAHPMPGLRQADLSMEPIYHWLATSGRDGLGVFNHPSEKGALQWDGLAFNRDVASQVAGIEIQGDQNFGGDHFWNSDGGWYWLALTRGWTIGPMMNWDTHRWRPVLAQALPGTRCGIFPAYLPCQRTLVISTGNSPAEIVAAIRARRTSATEHPSSWGTLRGPGGLWQGSTVDRSALRGGVLDLTVDAGSTRWNLTSVEIVSDAGRGAGTYFDGDSLACGHETSLQCDAKAFADFGPVAASYIEAHRRWLAADGHGVRKDRIDGPPPGTRVAVVKLHGQRAQVVLHVPLPKRPSVRPDGKHFFYAIVHAGPVRVWTSPIFVAP